MVQVNNCHYNWCHYMLHCHWCHVFPFTIGKSTTFKMVLGSLKPNNGDIKMTAERIGYCPQQNSIDSYLTTSKQLQVSVS